MAARFFSLTDKLSSLVGLAMVVRPFFELKHQQLDSSEQDACFFKSHLHDTEKDSIRLVFHEHIPAQPMIGVTIWWFFVLDMLSTDGIPFSISTTSPQTEAVLDTPGVFFSPMFVMFSPILGALKLEQDKTDDPSKFGSQYVGKVWIRKNLWGGSLWLIYHDTPGWWLPLSNGLSFSILWHMNSWLGMSTISTQQISEMKPTISFKIQDMLFFSDGPSMFLAEPTSPLSAPGPLICQSRETLWVWMSVGVGWLGTYPNGDIDVEEGILYPGPICQVNSVYGIWMQVCLMKFHYPRCRWKTLMKVFPS